MIQISLPTADARAAAFQDKIPWCRSEDLTNAALTAFAMTRSPRFCSRPTN